MAAGILLGYFQTRDSAPVQVASPQPKVGRWVQPPRTPQARRSGIATKAPSAAPAESPRQSPPLVQLPGICLVLPTPVAMPDVFLYNGRTSIQADLQEDGRLWSQSMQLDMDEMAGSGILEFGNKKPNKTPFQTLDVSNMSDIGAKYRLLQNEDTVFRGRLGGGLSRDYARLEEGQRIPEVLFGFQLEHQISQRNKILGAVEYARDLADFGRYRVRTEAAYEVLLDPEKNLSLRTGVLKSSNTSPNGEQTKNLDYTFDVIWKF